jgi:DNA mismatch endonuclease (patch repair protein)
MAKVRSKNTAPELVVRKIAHALGYRFRLHRADLPGKPDILFPKHRLAIFVHGCFWHRHPNCRRASMPATNAVKWQQKFEQNKVRDMRASSELAALG